MCKCNCGKIVHIKTGDLRSGNTRSCGCLAIETRSRRIGEINGEWFNRNKHAAKIRNYQFKVTKEFLSDLFERQKRKCKLTNLPIEIKFGNQALGSTASLDRINSKIGYLESNVQFVHKDVNRMKQSFNEEYFIKLCKLVYNNTLEEYDNKTNDWW